MKIYRVCEFEVKATEVTRVENNELYYVNDVGFEVSITRDKMNTPIYYAGKLKVFSLNRNYAIDMYIKYAKEQQEALYKQINDLSKGILKLEEDKKRV